MRRVRCRSRLEFKEGAILPKSTLAKAICNSMLGAKGLHGGISKVLLSVFNFGTLNCIHHTAVSHFFALAKSGLCSCRTIVQHP